MKLKLIYLQSIILFAITTILIACVTEPSIEGEELPKKKKTILEKYLTSVETQNFIQREDSQFLLVDVRTLTEIKQGMPVDTDAYIPIYFPQKSMTEPDKTNTVLNNNFIYSIEQALATKDLTATDTIILICRQGNRSARAVDKLAEAGYTNVYTVTDGFNGWKKSELPWNEEFDEDKIFFYHES